MTKKKVVNQTSLVQFGAAIRAAAVAGLVLQHDELVKLSHRRRLAHVINDVQLVAHNCAIELGRLKPKIEISPIETNIFDTRNLPPHYR